jgi:hypothetical protein
VTHVLLIIEADPDDSDETDGSGLTEEAFTRLSDAVADAGFTLVKGPDLEHTVIE